MAVRRKRILYVGDAVAGNEDFLSGLWSCAPDSWLIRGYDPTICGFDAVSEWKPDGLVIGVNRRSTELDSFISTQAKLARIYIGREGPAGSVQLLLDEAHLGRIAADYFIDRGFHNFAYPASLHGDRDLRLEGIQERLAAAGFSLLRPEKDESPSPWRNPGTTVSNDRAFQSWLKDLPKPVAVIVNSLWAGVGLLGQCREGGLRVPDDVAVLGIGSNSSLALSSSPELSCVQIDFRELGRKAARLLSRCLEGQITAPHTEIFRTGRVFSRGSTDLVTSVDPVVAKCLLHIQARFAEPLTVDDLAKVAGVSRRMLERRFQDNLHRSPFDEVQRKRFSHACNLLHDPSVRISEVGQRCGFGDPFHFSSFFKRRAKISPTAYRSKVLQG